MTSHPEFGPVVTAHLFPKPFRISGTVEECLAKMEISFCLSA